MKNKKTTTKNKETKEEKPAIIKLAEEVDKERKELSWDVRVLRARVDDLSKMVSLLADYVLSEMKAKKEGAKK